MTNVVDTMSKKNTPCKNQKIFTSLCGNCGFLDIQFLHTFPGKDETLLLASIATTYIGNT